MEASQLIDWNSPESTVLLNPRMPDSETRQIMHCLKSLEQLPKGHVWLATSGSSGTLKCVALSKDAILASAAAVNRHLQAAHSDIWLNPLPFFHVGGLGIYARSYLSRSQAYLIDGPWEPHAFVQQMNDVKATLTALVPTQVYDLVTRNLSPPPTLRAIVVGGGALSEKMYLEAIALGWKLLPSYGLTECTSQVATALLGSWEEHKYPLLKPLDHIKIGLTDEGLLKIKSQSLFTAYVYPNLSRCIDPKVDGWFITEDRADIVNGFLHNISRDGFFVKIGGESVDLSRLNVILDDARLALGVSEDMAIFAASDNRLGYVIHLAVAGHLSESVLETLLTTYHAAALPFEKIRNVRYIEEIPRTALKKLKLHELK